MDNDIEQIEIVSSGITVSGGIVWESFNMI